MYQNELSLGEAVKTIKEFKNRTIIEICQEQLSRAAYYRFINEQSSISVHKFLHILGNLEISLEEFMFIKRGYQPDRYQYFFQLLVQKYHEKDIITLTKILTLIQQHLDLSPRKSRYQQLALLATLFIEKLESNTVSTTIQQHLQEYFAELDTWTYHDLLLYGQTSSVFSSEFNLLMKRSAMSGLKKYRLLYSSIHFTAETMQLLVKLVFTEWKNNNIHAMTQYLDEIEAIDSDRTSMSIQFHQQFF